MSTTIPHSSAPPTCHGRWMSPDFESGLVSVIVPTYNRAHLIVETLDSVFAQTYRPIELLIVDDGSTDNTAEVVGEWQDVHQQEGFTIRFLTQKNSGAPAARNLGLIESRGEFIQFLDSDDLIHPEKLNLQVPKIRSGNYDYVWSPHEKFHTFAGWPDNNKPIELPELSVSQFLRKYCLTTNCGLYLRSICVTVGPWHEAAPVFQDAEYHLRLLLCGASTSHIGRLLSIFRSCHGAQISNQFMTSDALISFAWYEELFLRFDALSTEARRSLAKGYLQHAIYAIIAKNPSLARQHLQNSRRLYPTPQNEVKLLGPRLLAALPSAVSSVIGSLALKFYKSLRHSFQYNQLIRLNS